MCEPRPHGPGFTRPQYVRAKNYSSARASPVETTRAVTVLSFAALALRCWSSKDRRRVAFLSALGVLPRCGGGATGVLHHTPGAAADLLHGPGDAAPDIRHDRSGLSAGIPPSRPCTPADVLEGVPGAAADALDGPADPAGQLLQHLRIAVKRAQHPVDDRRDFVEPHP